MKIVVLGAGYESRFERIEAARGAISGISVARLRT